MKIVLAGLSLFVTLALVACGGGGGETTDASPAVTTEPEPPARHQGDSSSGAAQFETTRGDNSIQEFGVEAPGSERKAAAAVLHGYLDARAAGAWRDACSYMSAAFAASLAQLARGSGAGGECPEVLASFSAGLSAATLREAAVAEVGAMRTEGDRAFLLFHGTHGDAYFMPMLREGGWKVAAVAASLLG